MIENWTTRLPREYTARFGCHELHGVFFEPLSDRGGPNPAILVSIPEAPKSAIKFALKMATRRAARLGFICDTPAQAAEVTAYAARRLPKHQRIAVERAEAGGWGAAAA